MSDLPEFLPGETLHGFPGGRMQKLVDAVAEALRDSGDARAEAARRAGQLLARHQLRVKVVSGDSSTLDPYSVLGFNGLSNGVTSLDEAEASAHHFLVEGVTPATSHGSKFLVLQAPAKLGDVVEACVLGLTLVRVNITSTSHAKAQIEGGNAARLASGAEGVDIWWKETASTGEQWCLVLIGGGSGGDHPHAIAFTSSGGSAASISVAITSVYSYFGADPPGSPPATAANVDGYNIAPGSDFMIAEGDWPLYGESTSYSDDDIVTYDNGGGLRRWVRTGGTGVDGAFNAANWADTEAATNWKIAYVFSSGEPQSYNVRLQAAKAKAATSVSVKLLNTSFAEVGTAFAAYDPHQKFSSGKVANAVGRVARVTDAETGVSRWELTHLTSLARYVEATLAEDEGASAAGKASATSYVAHGNGWHVTSPTGTINITRLSGQKTGDVVKAVLVNPDATLQEYMAVDVPDKAEVFTFENTGTAIALGASGTCALQTISGGAPSDGANQTVHNTKTHGTIWPDAFGTCYKAPDGSYVAVAHDSATIFTAVASSASNSGNSYTAFTAGTPVGKDGSHPGTTLSGVTNPLSLEINSGSQVVVVGNAAGSLLAASVTPDEPGCGLKRNDADSKKWEVDSDIFGSGLTVVSDGDCFYVTAAGTTYSAGCGLDLAGSTFSVDPGDLFQGASFGLEPSGSGCGGQVVTGCGAKLEPGVGVMADNGALAGYCLQASGECSLDLNPSCVEEIVNNWISININIVINQILDQYPETTEYVLTDCTNISISGGELEITYERKQITFLGSSSGGGTATCSVSGNETC